MNRWLAARASLAFLASLPLLAGCGSGGGGGGTTSDTTLPKLESTVAPSSTPAPASTTTSTTAAPKTETEAIIAGYIAGERVHIEAGKIPDPNHPGLALVRTGPMLQRSRDLFQSFIFRGILYHYPSERPDGGARIMVKPNDVEKVDSDTAFVRACLVDYGHEIYANTGKPVTPGDRLDAITTAEVRATMELVGGVWKLSERRGLEQWEGVAGCAAS